jgi:hypothetical protein
VVAHRHTPCVTSSRTRARLDAASGPVLTAVLSLAAAVQALQLWQWRPGTPLSLRDDSPQVLIQIRAIIDSGWYSVVPSQGAPFGLNASWYTTADTLNFACIRVLGWFSDSPATVGAVFFVLGFPAAALTAYWLGRRLSLSRPAAVVVGVLFSVLPGHQVWFGHPWLASYWMVPLAVWLVVQVAGGGELWPTRSALRARGPQGRRARWLAARTVLVVLPVGLADVYYVAFTLILLAVALVVRLGTGTRVTRLLPAAAVTAAIGLLCALPLFISTRGRSGDQVTGGLAAQRVIGDSELYAGKLIELVLPWYQHRVSALRFLSYAYGVAAPPSVERPALGVVALCGVAALLWMCVTALVVGRKVAALPGILAGLTLVSLAFYTRAGLGSVVALFLTPQIRTWSRFVVLIGLFGLVAAGLWLTRLGLRHGRRAAWAAAGLVLLVGVLDQTSPGAAPDYASNRAQQQDLTTYTRTLARALPAGCAVFQLPIVSFPEEPPPGAMGDYDHFLPSQAAPVGLSWSYGAVRGTARSDWQLALPLGDQQRLLRDIAAAGFCAVEIDSDGYAGSVDPSATTQSLLGAPVARTSKAHLAAYALGPLQAELTRTLGEAQVEQRRDAVLHPVVATVDGSLVDVTGSTPGQWTGPQTVVSVSNLGRTSVPVTLTMDIAGNGDLARTLTLTTEGLPTQRLRVSAVERQGVKLDLVAQPGTTRVTVEADGDAAAVRGTDGRQLAALRISDLRVSTTSDVNAASLQQFTAASPRPGR